MVGLIRLFNRLMPFVALVFAYLGYQAQQEWVETKLKPVQAQVISKQGELEAKIKELKLAEDFVAKRDEKKRELFRLKEEVDREAKSVPQKASLPEVLTALADRSDQTGLEFSKFAPQAEAKQNFLVMTPFMVTLKGTYTQIMSFLDAAANMERAVTTESLQIDTPSSPKGGASILSAQATMVAYYIDMTVLAAPMASANKDEKKEGK